MNISIEQMREIVDGAPDDAYYWHGLDGTYYHMHGPEFYIDSVMYTAISLADLRAAIAEHDRPKQHNKNYAKHVGLNFYATRDYPAEMDSLPFLIKFDDADREDVWLKCSEEEAITAWENFSVQWNCYLFELKKVKDHGHD